jgi:hypothetical protein
MSISRSDARTYIARIIGGANDPKVLDMAEEALVRGFSDWQTAKDWEDTLKDTSSLAGVTLTGHTHLGQAYIHEAGDPTPATGLLNAINVGDTFTAASGFTGTLTVISYTRDTNGNINLVTFDQNSTGSGNVVFTKVGTTIPILVGVQDYNVPLDFWKPYMARLTSKAQWPIEYIRPRFWNRRTLSSTVQGLVEAYTIFNSISPNTQNFGTKRLRVYRVPSAVDTLELTYYRKLNALSDPLDMNDVYLYKFLDDCRAILLKTKRAQDNPEAYIKDAASGIENAMVSDEEISEDEDKRMISQMEVGDAQRPLWTNGPFNPDYGF